MGLLHFMLHFLIGPFLADCEKYFNAFVSNMLIYMKLREFEPELNWWPLERGIILKSELLEYSNDLLTDFKLSLVPEFLRLSYPEQQPC